MPEQLHKLDWQLAQKDLGVAVAELVALLFLGWLLSFVLGRFLRILTQGAESAKAKLLAERARKMISRGMMVVTTALAVGLSCLNGYLLLSGRGVLAAQKEFAAQISPETQRQLVLSILGLLVAAWLCSLFLRLVEKGIARLSAWAERFDGVEGNDQSVERLFVSLSAIVQRCTWLAFAWLAAWTVGVPEAGLAIVSTVIKVYALIAGGLLLWRSLDVVITTLQELGKKKRSEHPWWGYHDRLEHLIPVARRSLEYVIYVSFASMAVGQVSFVAGIAEWGPRVVRVIGYFFVARVAVSVVTVATDEWATRRAKADLAQNQRLLTLVPLFQSLQKYGIYFFVAVATLDAIGVNPGPILAGAGIAGLAVGFGAQSVIKDIVTGFFILFENYFVVGDFVQIGEVRGIVMGVDLRTTRLRDIEGGLHIIPNGDVTHVVHYSKDFATAVVDIGVAYDADLDKVRAVLEKVGEELLESDDRVIAKTEVLGVQALGESDVVIRTLTKARPGQHFEVGRLVRESAKRAFDDEGIEIPFARRVLILQDERESAAS